jgi:hypothetical protein
MRLVRAKWQISASAGTRKVALVSHRTVIDHTDYVATGDPPMQL